MMARPGKGIGLCLKQVGVKNNIMNVPLHIVPQPEKLRLRVEDFLLLNNSGAFDKHHKTELIEGEIYSMNAQHSRHARTKTQLAVEMANCLKNIGSDLTTLVEVSTRISEYSLPEPDIVITNYNGDDVVPLDSVALIVEVSDTTVSIDLGSKLELYAKAGIPEYWVCDVNLMQIIRMWQPSGEGYLQTDNFAFDAVLKSATIKGFAIQLC